MTPVPARDRTAPLLALVLLGGTMAFMAFNAVIGLVARDLGVNEWQVGIVITASGLAMMVSARFWGRRSDARGRRPVLMAGLVGNAAGYAALALFVIAAAAYRPEPLWVFAGLLAIRFAASLFYAGVQPAAQALMADITTPAERPRGMALLGLGSALGMVAGPGAASLLAPSGLTWPLWGAAVIAIAATVLGSRLAAPARSPPQGAVELATLSAFDRRLRVPLLVAVAAMLCVVSPQLVTGFFAQDRFGLTSPAAAGVAGQALTGTGLALVAASLVVRRTGWPPRILLLAGAPIAAIGFSGAVLVTAPWQMVLGYVVAGFGMGFVFPGFQTAASLAVSEHEQGSALATVAVAQAVGITVGPVIAAVLYRSVGPPSPFLLSAVLLVGIGLLATRLPEPAG